MLVAMDTFDQLLPQSGPWPRVDLASAKRAQSMDAVVQKFLLNAVLLSYFLASVALAHGGKHLIKEALAKIDT